MKKFKLLFSTIALMVIVSIMMTTIAIIPTSAATAYDLTYTDTCYDGSYYVYSFTTPDAVDLSSLFVVFFSVWGHFPEIWISDTNAADANWESMTMSLDGLWASYAYNGAKEYLNAGTIYVKAHIPNGEFVGNHYHRFYTQFDPYVPEPTPADGEVVYISDIAGGGRLYKISPSKDVDLSTLSIQVNVADANWGHTPILSIATSKESNEWIPLTVVNKNEWWRWYSHTGDVEYIPAGNIYIKVLPSNAGDACAITQPSYTYSEYIPEPILADGEIVPTGNIIGNAHIWKMYAENDVDLSTLRLTYNEGGWTPEIAISKTNSADAEWMLLDVDAGNPYGWRYYTYSGAEKSLDKGYIYIKVLNTGKINQYGDASVNPTNFTSEYEGYVELGDGDTIVSYYRGPGNAVHRADAENEINLKEFKFVCNVNDWNIGWTPNKVYIAKSLASDAVWYELDCTYSDATTTNYGWRHYTYSGDDVTLEAGTFFIKIGASGKSEIESDFITQSYYTYSNQIVGDLHEDGEIDILDLVCAKKIFVDDSFDYIKALDMDHSATNNSYDLNLLRQFLLQY